MKKILGVLLVLISVGCVSLVVHMYLEEKNRTPSQTIISKWSKDIKKISSELPKSWSEISQIRIQYSDDKTKDFFKEIKNTHIAIKPDADYVLYVIVTSVDQNDFIFQHNMVHKPTGEMLWELNRSYSYKSIVE